MKKQILDFLLNLAYGEMPLSCIKELSNIQVDDGVCTIDEMLQLNCELSREVQTAFTNLKGAGRTEIKTPIDAFYSLAARELLLQENNKHTVEDNPGIYFIAALSRIIDYVGHDGFCEVTVLNCRSEYESYIEKHRKLLDANDHFEWYEEVLFKCKADSPEDALNKFHDSTTILEQID